MFVPIYLFWNYVSPFPWWLGPVLQVVGIFFLWTTRQTARYYPGWGRKYYWFSGMVRPLGILVIAWAWLEIASVEPDFYLPGFLQNHPSFLPMIFLFCFIFFILTDRFLMPFIFPIILFDFFPGAIPLWLNQSTLPPIVVLLLSLIFAIWSIITLGFRQSFLYSKIEDQLIAKGPYLYFRHPQLLAAILVTLSSICMLAGGYLDRAIVSFQLVNALILIIGLYLITRSEDHDLEKRFGESFLNYKKGVPGFWSPKLRERTFKLRWVFILTFLAYIISAFLLLSSAMGLRRTGSELVFVGRSYRHWDQRYHSTMNYLTKFAYFIPWEERKSPTEIRIPEGLKESIAAKAENCPVTIFYCNQSCLINSFYSENIKPRRRLQTIKPVKELPFELECTQSKMEIAATYNCDSDEFLQITLVTIDGSTIETIYAADDFRDRYADEIKARLKK